MGAAHSLAFGSGAGNKEADSSSLWSLQYTQRDPLRVWFWRQRLQI